MGVLTADCRARLENGLNLRIQLNHHFLFLGKIKVSCFQLSINPISEGFSNDGMDNISYVLSGHFLYFLVSSWKRFHNLRKHFSIFKHFLYVQSFKLWHGYVKHVFSSYTASLTPSKIPKVPDSNIFYRRQINICFSREKPVYLSFASILCCKGSNCNFSYLWCIGDNLVLLRHGVFKWVIKLNY